MIDQTKLDELKQILDRKGQYAYGVAFDVAGIAEDEDAFDLDLLRDLVASYEARDKDLKAVEDRSYQEGYEAGEADYACDGYCCDREHVD